MTIVKINKAKGKSKLRRRPQSKKLSKLISIESFYEVVGILRSCILFLFLHQKSFKVLNCLKLF